MTSLGKEASRGRARCCRATSSGTIARPPQGQVLAAGTPSGGCTSATRMREPGTAARFLPPVLRGAGQSGDPAMSAVAVFGAELVGDTLVVTPQADPQGGPWGAEEELLCLASDPAARNIVVD